MRDDLQELSRRWTDAAQSHPVARRLLPWAESLLDAADVSWTCGLEVQSRDIVRRVEARLEAVMARPSIHQAPPDLSTTWSAQGLCSEPDSKRQERVWRRVRSLRAHRLPFAGEGHPREQGLAWGPYNRQSAVAEALSAMAGVDPLWVDELLERERALYTVDRLLGPG